MFRSASRIHCISSSKGGTKSIAKMDWRPWPDWHLLDLPLGGGTYSTGLRLYSPEFVFNYTQILNE